MEKIKSCFFEQFEMWFVWREVEPEEREFVIEKVPKNELFNRGGEVIILTGYLLRRPLAPYPYEPYEDAYCE